MSQKLYVRRGGGASGTATDYMDRVAMGVVRKGAAVFDGQRPLIQMGRRAADGEASQGYFNLVDPEAEIHSTTYRLSPHALVTWTEDASGDELWLARGRIAPLESGRRASYIGGTDVEWDVTVNDNNMDLRGQAFSEAWVRPAETDNARILALHAYTLNSTSSTAPHKRNSCDITCSTSHLISTAFTRMMPARTYPAGTQPQEVIAECAERSGKTYAVVIHHTGGSSHDCLLYVGALDHATYTTDVKISDEIADLDLEDATAPVFPPVWDQGKGTLTENDDVVSGVVVIYGGTTGEPLSVFVHDPADETPYEYWVDAINDDKVDTLAEATNLAEQYFTSHRAPGRRTHRFSVKMLTSQHHLITAGMSMQVKGAVLAGGADLGTYVWRRISELRWEPDPDPRYIWARIQLEKPLRRRGLGVQPTATTPTTPPDCIPQEPDTETILSSTVSNAADWPGTTGSTGTCWGGVSHETTGGSGGITTPATSVSVGDTVFGRLEFREETGNDSWENVDSYNYRARLVLTHSGGGVTPLYYTIVNQRYHNAGCINVTHEATAVVPSGYNQAQVQILSRLGGYRYRGWIGTITYSTPVENDPYCIPAGTGGTSPYYARSDDPRFTADDQHLVTKTQQRVVNNTAGVLSIGDVVIPDTSYDGAAVTTTTTANLTDAMVGIVTGAMGAGETGTVMWSGKLEQPLNVGANTAADGDYLYTSTTAGTADVSATRSVGAVGRVIRDDAGTPSYTLWWGVPDEPASVAEITDLPTSETDDTLVLAPDGVGGVEWRAESGVTDHGALTGLADNDHPQYRLTTGGGEDVINVVAASGASEALPATANDHQITLTADCAITLPTLTSGVYCSISLLLIQDGTGSRLVDWSANTIDWIGGSEPTLETAAGTFNRVNLETRDGGTTWIGDGGGGTSTGPGSGHYEVVMAEGLSSPPEPVTNDAGDDWVYGWVSD